MAYSETTITSMAEVDAQVREVEARYDLLRYTIDGWSVWPILRRSVSLALLNQPSLKTSKKDLYRWFYGKRIVLALRDLPKLLTRKKARYAVKTYISSLRLEHDNGLYGDIYFDDVLCALGGEVFNIQSLTNELFIPRRRLAQIKHDVTADTLDTMAKLLVRMGGLRNISNIAHDLHACLDQEWHLKRFPFEMIIKMLKGFYWGKRLYGWLLKRTGAKYLLMLNTYNEHTIVAAARDANLKVIEFQHGFLSRHHTGYSWSTYALGYKKQMPLPNELFLYGEYWKQELNTNGFWGDTLQVTGNPYLDKYRRGNNFSSNGICKITLTTQRIDIEKLMTFMTQFLEIAKKQLEVHLYIKLHPFNTIKEPIVNAFNFDSRVTVLLSHEAPMTNELLATSDFHTSIYSTCHYEAIALGTPTIILPFRGHDMVMHLFKTGHASFVRTPQEFFEVVAHHKESSIPTNVSSWYYKPEAVKNITALLGNLC